MKSRSTILIFLDEEITPLCETDAPFNFELDTRKLTDGPHHLRIVSRDPSGREGLRNIPFEVRNGPAIIVDGISEHDVVDGILPVMVNAYSKGDQKSFYIEGSESPRVIPAWVYIIMISFIAWAMFYLVRFIDKN